MKNALAILAGLLFAFSAHAEVRVTYLANEAYLVSADEAAILLDAFVPEPYYGYAALDDAHWQAMLGGTAEFDGVVAAVASHEHLDHIQPEAAGRYLSAHGDVRLFTTPAAAGQMKGIPAGQVVPVLPAWENTVVQEAGPFRLTFLRLAHRANRGDDIQNLGVIVEARGVKILHLGDAYPDVRNFDAFDLEGLDIDLAIVPEWFFIERYFPGGPSLVEEHIGADQVVLTHYALEGLEDRLARFRERFPEVRHLTRPSDEMVIQ